MHTHIALMIHTNNTILTKITCGPLILEHVTYGIWKFNAGHHCQKKGCGTVLVLKGNQKNNHPVCAAKEAEFVEYVGLPGKVKTGYMATPEQTGIFCSLHKPHQLKRSSGPETQHKGQHGVVEMILTKKETRNTTHYEVNT